MRIPIDDTAIEGDLDVPVGARSVVVFAHGSGSSRFSARNQQVAAALGSRGLATLLVDLLTLQEEEVEWRSRELRFDVGLLARRLVDMTDWLAAEAGTRQLAVGYFGASTGAAAALVAAAMRPEVIRAVVSRGGRPDLAGRALARVVAPTLLVVGGEDRTVRELNEEALDELAGPRQLIVVPGATHRFEEAGALEEVARLAADWFERYLGSIPIREASRWP